MVTLRFVSYSFLCAVLFVILSGAYRAVLPFGDEPDFDVRAQQLVLGEHSIWSPYNWFSSLYSQMQYSSFCKIEATATSPSADIDEMSCTEQFEQRVIRWLLMLFLCIPLIISSVFYLFKEERADDFERNCVLATSLVFPGVIYYLGVFSIEQLTLITSLLCFVFWRHKTILFCLISIVLLLDFGNGIVVLLFVAMLIFYSYIHKQFGLKFCVYMMFGQVVLCYVIGYSILGYTQGFAPLAEKSQSMYRLLESGGLVEKYPVILRPIITYMTLIFFTPAYLKAPIVYAIFGCACLFMGRRIYRTLQEKKVEQYEKIVLQSMVAITLIVSFVFFFPNYANGKYYVFLIPFIIYPLFFVVHRIRLLSFFLTMNVLILIHVMYFSL
ncbi:hypothetical protein [Pseudoalteromonas luteoviolacea]|uniref:Glycosyltransferase RgtA/B/C/D-like domain-containing protein n=1 Tax=Pseudoalteromonas luteoviolacea S4054 TaxID=1129367 RepID=A0A0F6ACL9_9GAMM|nr:hypothetical protein [Pseudoalteromonas luteoviolacea]AOT09694.1 hypothetical protein S4054249_18530 [Pseudoalteromonas luteoviolacea]AOT14607.1 hypothetical protein S40542_18500 [Pseudoalteromonas luteoviolacea]AOT19521.1 hypothetical protein S4054_18505 [Pseudoalteromonas luteoviolacea]KKE83962.1 hypothetical protein N479_11155 [Pseudoalteromonas luteoviolacea S4054]KZN77356.1 hypothetical protein N481_04695 [Pseudoalteromonas luteoviolacea S4047-1]